MHHKNKKHHALQLRRRELLFTICSSRAFINVSGDVDVHQELVDAVLDRLWFLGSADNGQLGVDRAIPTPLRKNTLTVPHIPKVTDGSDSAQTNSGISTVTIAVAWKQAGRP